MLVLMARPVLNLTRKIFLHDFLPFLFDAGILEMRDLRSFDFTITWL